MTYLWLIVIIVSLLLEAGTYSLVAIWFIPSAIVSLVLSLFEVSVAVQTLVFFVLSVLSVLFLRKHLSNALKKKNIPTNADALIGKSAIVTEDIDNINFKGQVKVNGQIWKAKAHDDAEIKSGDTVEIKAIEGVKLICKKI